MFKGSIVPFRTPAAVCESVYGGTAPDDAAVEPCNLTRLDQKALRFTRDMPGVLMAFSPDELSLKVASGG